MTGENVDKMNTHQNVLCENLSEAENGTVVRILGEKCMVSTYVPAFYPDTVVRTLD